MKLTNEHGLPEIIERAIRNDPYDPGESDITATTLINPPQIRYLKKHYDDEIVIDVTERIWAVKGQATHVILERAAGPDDVVEWRLYGNMDGWRIGGQIDLLTVEGGQEVLVDFKETSAWSWVYEDKGYKPEWESQLNVLAWLAEQNGANVSRLELVPLYRDWQRSKAEEDTYPTQPSRSIDIPLWSHDEREAYIRERVRLHQEADQGRVTPCTPEEQWAKKDQWAIKKDGRKSAVRVFDNPQMAEQYMKDVDGEFWIEHRPGKRVRCEDNYCPVRDFCKQYQMEQDGQTVPDVILYEEGA